jgi:hypothetical protein
MKTLAWSPSTRARWCLLAAVGAAMLVLSMTGCSKKTTVQPAGTWRVEGVLRYEDGRPAPVVYVQLAQLVLPLTGGNDLHLDRALTDVAGHFRFEGVPAGYFGLHAFGPADTLVAGTQFLLGVAAPAGGTREIPLMLVRAGTFRGIARRLGGAHHATSRSRSTARRWSPRSPTARAATRSAGFHPAIGSRSR